MESPIRFWRTKNSRPWKILGKNRNHPCRREVKPTAGGELGGVGFRWKSEHFWQKPYKVLLKRFVGCVGIVLGTFQGKYPGKSNLKQSLFKKKHHLCTRKSFMGRPCFFFCKVFWEENWRFVQILRILFLPNRIFCRGCGWGSKKVVVLTSKIFGKWSKFDHLH